MNSKSNPKPTQEQCPKINQTNKQELTWKTDWPRPKMKSMEP